MSTNEDDNEDYIEDDNFDNFSVCFRLSGELYEIQNPREREFTVVMNNANADIPEPSLVRIDAIRGSDIYYDKSADKNDIEEERPKYKPFKDYDGIKSHFPMQNKALISVQFDAFVRVQFSYA